MSAEELRAYLESLSDSEVLHMLRNAVEDTKAAGASEPNSDWHSACFAASVAYAQEANRRGIGPQVQH